MSSIIARSVRQLLPHLTEQLSEEVVREIATTFSKSHILDHADQIARFVNDLGGDVPGRAGRELRGGLGKLFGELASASSARRTRWNNVQEDVAKKALVRGGTPEHLIKRHQINDLLKQAPGFDIEDAIEEVDSTLLARAKTPEFEEFAQTVDAKRRELQKPQDPILAAESTFPFSGPASDIRTKQVYRPSGTTIIPRPIELPTGTVMEILSEPNPARESTARYLENEVELITRRLARTTDFTFSRGMARALEGIFGKKGALVQILDPDTPFFVSGKRAARRQGREQADNNFVRLLNEAGLPGAQIANKARSVGKQDVPTPITFEEAKELARNDLLEEGMEESAPGFGLRVAGLAKQIQKEANAGFERDRYVRAAYVGATIDYLEAVNPTEPAQHAWASYQRQRDQLKGETRFRILPGPESDVPIVPPAVGLIQTVIDTLREADPTLSVRDILDPQRADVRAMADDLRPVGLTMPRASVVTNVGTSTRPYTVELLPLNHPSFGTEFNRDFRVGELIRLDPKSKLIQSAGLEEATDLYMIIDETAFMPPTGKDPKKAIAIARINPATGSVDTGSTVLLGMGTKVRTKPFSVLKPDDPARELVVNPEEQAQKLALELRRTFAPTLKNMGEAGENLFTIHEPSGRIVSMTTERHHAFEFARQGLIVRPKPFGKLTPEEARAGMKVAQTTLEERWAAGAKELIERRTEDLSPSFADLNSPDVKIRQSAFRRLARALVLSEPAAVKQWNSVRLKEVTSMYRLGEALETMVKDKRENVLARHLRKVRRLGRQERGVHGFEKELIAEDIGENVGEEAKLLNELERDYFTEADIRRISADMERHLVIGGAPPSEISKLARRMSLDDVLQYASTPQESGTATSEIRKAALATLMANPEYLGRSALEQAQSARMLATYGEQVKKSIPFNSVLDELAGLHATSQSRAKILIGREKFLDEAANDPAGFMMNFLDVHVNRAEKKGLKNVRVEISRVDDDIVPNITLIGHDPVTGQAVKKVVPLSPGNTDLFLGFMQKEAQMWDDFEQRVRTHPTLGGACTMTDVRAPSPPSPFNPIRGL